MLPLCYLADALLFDALYRKDVLSGGRELHSRLYPIAGGRGLGETLALHRRYAFRTVRAVRAR